MRSAHAAVAARAGLELRLGFELTPTPRLLAEDLRRYRLGGTDFVLMEVPFTGPSDDLWALAEHADRSDHQPVIAHPERSEAVESSPDEALLLAERGWLLQVNATSLLGRRPDRGVDRLGAARAGRRGARGVGRPPADPATLDTAYAVAVERLGVGARRFFDGSALGLAGIEPAIRTA